MINGTRHDQLRPAVVVVDDDTVIRDGLPLLLGRVRVVGTFADTDSFLSAHIRADLVLLDLGLQGAGTGHGVGGAEAVRLLARAGHRVLVYSNDRRREVLVHCIANGAVGIVHKAEPIAALEEAVRHVAGDGVWITSALSGLAELAVRRGALPALTSRQREVLAGRARGETFHSIAGRLFITQKTAEEHMAVVTRKFAEYLRTHSPADLERHLGLEPAHLVDWIPPYGPDPGTDREAPGPATSRGMGGHGPGAPTPTARSPRL